MRILNLTPKPNRGGIIRLQRSAETIRNRTMQKGVEAIKQVFPGVEYSKLETMLKLSERNGRIYFGLNINDHDLPFLEIEPRPNGQMLVKKHIPSSLKYIDDLFTPSIMLQAKLNSGVKLRNHIGSGKVRGASPLIHTFRLFPDESKLNPNNPVELYNAIVFSETEKQAFNAYVLLAQKLASVSV